MPLKTSGNGISETGTKFRKLCPDVKVGDKLYLRFGRVYLDGEVAPNHNTMIYFHEAGYIWYQTASGLTITEEMLNSVVSLYANRFIDGETKQVILKDFRIVKNPDDEFEPYKKWYEY